MANAFPQAPPNATRGPLGPSAQTHPQHVGGAATHSHRGAAELPLPWAGGTGAHSAARGVVALLGTHPREIHL